jgi:hypothetical protein
LQLNCIVCGVLFVVYRTSCCVGFSDMLASQCRDASSMWQADRMLGSWAGSALSLSHGGYLHTVRSGCSWPCTQNRAMCTWSCPWFWLLVDSECGCSGLWLCLRFVVLRCTWSCCPCTRSLSCRKHSW